MKRKAPVVLGLSQQLCFALYSASHTMTKLYQPLLKPLGLTYPQFIVLVALFEKDDVSLTELGEKLFLDSGTLTPLLKRMEQAGLIGRKRSDQDERTLRISLLTKGQALAKSAAKMSGQRIAPATSCSFAEREVLIKLLTQLRKSLAGNLVSNN